MNSVSRHRSVRSAAVTLFATVALTVSTGPLVAAAPPPDGPDGPDAGAAVVVLANGDRVSGAIVDLHDGSLTVDTAWGGELSVDWSLVAGIESATELTLVLDDGSRLVGRVGPVEAPGDRPETAERIAVRTASVTEPALVELSRVTAINPPARSVRVKGNASAGLIVNQGNTDTHSLYLEGEVVARTDTNRYTTGAQATRAEDDGETTADSSRGWIEYDHFLSERWYLSSSALFTRDEFQDLRLRSSLAASTGYQFVESDRAAASAELGASYVDEDFYDAPDDSYPAARWAVDLSRSFADGDLELFHSHEGFLNLDTGDDVLLRSKTGVRFNLFRGFVATTQVNFDYDTDPAPGREKEDWRYLLNLGVEW
jgi:putative salt-induced outer membrane protein YdiY